MSIKLQGFLATLFVFLTIGLSGQDLNSLQNADLSKINIDALTDEQVQQFLDKAQESGLTLGQLELAAQQRGMSSTQIAKLRTRIRQLQSGVSTQDDSFADQPGDRLRESLEDEPDQYEFFNMLETKDDEEDPDALKIFGMDIFNSGDVTFEPSLNVATPENYVLGPGDEIIIDVYGASETTYQQSISPDGDILVSGVGPINLGGLSVKEAKIRIFNKLSSIYSGVKGRKPNTFIQVSVGDVKTIKVNVVGNVIRPGTYTLSSFATAFNAIYFAGGPTENGSMRSISVVRNGKNIADLDIYKFLYQGDNLQNPSLKDQDVIVVKPYLNRVILAGKC